MSELKHCGFISLLYSIGEKPLNLWSKRISSDGKICRIIDNEFLNGDKIIAITGPHNVPVYTNITCPADSTDVLNIKLPILVLIIKNLQLRLKLEFQILDKEKFRRKLTFLNEEFPPKISTTVARLPLKLEENWNNLEINFQILCHDIFGTDYDVIQRIVIYSNCHIRRIYMQDRHYEYDEKPAKLFQAFFDMYLLKWGINFVDKTSQTEKFNNIEPVQTSNTKTITIAKNSKSSVKFHWTPSQSNGSKQKTRQFSTKNIKTKQIKNTKKEEKKLIKVEKNINDKETNEFEFPISISINNNESSRDMEKFSNIIEKSKYLEILKKSIPNKFHEEGNIFSKWPYKFDNLHKTTNNVTTINDSIINKQQNIIQNLNKKIEENIPITKESLLKKTNINFQNENVTKIKEIINEVHKIRQQINEKNYDLEFSNDNDNIIPEFVEIEAKNFNKKSQSKLLTSDLIVNELFKSRFKLKTIFERLKRKGFSMKNMELSIQNTGERKNSYGQGKLIESCRGSVNKSTDCDEMKKKEKKKKTF